MDLLRGLKRISLHCSSALPAATHYFWQLCSPCRVILVRPAPTSIDRIVTGGSCIARPCANSSGFSLLFSQHCYNFDPGIRIYGWASTCGYIRSFGPFERVARGLGLAIASVSKPDNQVGLESCTLTTLSSLGSLGLYPSSDIVHFTLTGLMGRFLPAFK